MSFMMIYWIATVICAIAWCVILKTDHDQGKDINGAVLIFAVLVSFCPVINVLAIVLGSLPIITVYCNRTVIKGKKK